MRSTVRKHTSALDRNIRKRRLKQLINDVYDLKNDKYIRVNHLGKIECKLCYTVHNNESSYIMHRSSTRHQLLAEKKIKRERELNRQPEYKMYNVRNEDYQGYFVKIKTKHNVFYRIVDAIEQNVEPANKNYNYLVFKIKGYDNIGLKIDASENYKIIKHFNGFSFKLQILYKIKNS